MTDPSAFAEVFRVATLRYRAEQCRAMAQDWQAGARTLMLTLAKIYDKIADDLEGVDGRKH